MSAVANEVPRDHLGRWTPPSPIQHHDLLSVVALADWSPTSDDVRENLLSACEADAKAHAGIVSVMRVRDMVAELNIPRHTWSAFWSHYTGPGQPMEHMHRLEPCYGSKSRNNGKPYPVRRWVG